MRSSCVRKRQHDTQQPQPAIDFFVNESVKKEKSEDFGKLQYLRKGLLQRSTGLGEIPEIIQEIALVLVLCLKFVELLCVAVLESLKVATLKPRDS